jgi:hypothetical protein
MFNKFTEYSNHYIDWSRIGELWASKSHQYSTRQLLDRGIIVAFTAVCGYLGNYYNEEEYSGCSNTAVTLATSLLGFTVSHAVIIIPLIQKRYAMQQECTQYRLAIEQIIAEPDCTYRKEVGALMEIIMNTSLGDAKHAKASETWGHRKNTLKAVLYTCTNSKDPEFWKREPSLILDDLNAIQLGHLRPTSMVTDDGYFYI